MSHNDKKGSISRFFPIKKRPHEELLDSPVVESVIDLQSDEDNEAEATACKAARSVSLSLPPAASQEDEQGPISLPEIATNEVESLSENEAAPANPFARFALSSSSSSPSKQTDLTRWIRQSPTKKKKPSTFQASGTEWIKMQDLSPEEQEKIVRKWHGMTGSNAGVEDARFQVLVAARLHAQCREAAVRNAMHQLRLHFNNDLTVERVASAAPESFVKAITNLQYHNTKARHLVMAANEIKTQFGGTVPEQEAQLRKITGVGPVIADLLSFVNTRRIHEKQRASRRP